MRLVLAAVLLLTGCAQLQRVLPTRLRSDERLARSVTIVRDEWGVPTVYATSDAGVAFGIAYAQAEDNFWQIEEEYIHALGRAAGYYGERYLAADLLYAAFEVERLSREEYEREPAERKAIWNGYAQGLNYYLRAHQARPRLIARFEPWMPFALFRSATIASVIDGVRLGTAVTSTDALAGSSARLAAPITLVGTWTDSLAALPLDDGSSMWAAAPARSAGGRALLALSPHVEFFATGQQYEAQLHSDTGWHVRGFMRLGTPLPHTGHNEHIGFGHTRSTADHADVFELAFDHPSDPLSYRANGEWQRAQSWSDTLLVNTANGVERRGFTFLKTLHGPVVAQRGNRALAVRVARMFEGGQLQQWYAIGRATDLAQFRDALAQPALVGANTIYADVQGNIAYVHGGAVPARDTTLDWSQPVAADDARATWHGYHPLAELPQVHNPASGWLVSTSSAPLAAVAARADSVAAGYPSYLGTTGAAPARTRALQRLFAGDSAWSFERWAASPFDSYISDAERAIASLVREWEAVGAADPGRAMRLDDALDRLRAWDRRSSITSSEMTLYTLWQERWINGEYRGTHPRFAALEDAVSRIPRDADSAFVAWGELNRLQRIQPPTRTPFRDDLHSIPNAAGPPLTGSILTARTETPPGSRMRYGSSGNWMIVVELASEPRSQSVVTFGQSALPASPHHTDQLALYARGALKPAHFSRAHVSAQARRTYQPGAAATDAR